MQRRNARLLINKNIRFSVFGAPREYLHNSDYFRWLWMRAGSLARITFAVGIRHSGCFRLWFRSGAKLFGIMEISVCHFGARSVYMQIELQQADSPSIRHCLFGLHLANAILTGLPGCLSANTLNCNFNLFSMRHCRMENSKQPFLHLHHMAYAL